MRISIIPIGLAMAIATSGACQAGAPAKQQAVAIAFALTADGKEVGCGAPLGGLGSGHVEAKLHDARFYLYGVKLIDAKGARTPVALAQNIWQYADLALLDFKDARGGGAPCSESAPAKNTTVTGTAPAHAYVGLEFSVGVPVEGQAEGKTVALNHGAMETAAPPLDVVAMGWSWQAGRDIYADRSRSNAFRNQGRRQQGQDLDGSSWVLRLQGQSRDGRDRLLRA